MFGRAAITLGIRPHSSSVINLKAQLESLENHFGH